MSFADLVVLLSTLAWAATFPATKAVLATVPPFAFLFLRFLLGTLVVVGGLLAAGCGLRADAAMVRMSGVAAVFLVLGYGLQTLGLQHTTASNSAFITVLYVVLVPLLLRRFGVRTWLSAGLALAGLWLLVDPQVALNPGDLLTVGCAAAFAGHIICLERYCRRAAGSPFLAWQLVWTALAMGVATVVVEGPSGLRLEPTPVLLVGLTVNGVLATGAFAVQVWAQRLLLAHRIALIYSVEPAFAAWLAWYFLGEQLGPSGWVGSGLILAGVLVGCLGAGAADRLSPVPVRAGEPAPPA
ncbi:DMT family transporter [Nitrospira sp. Kam-Ns4a]